MTYFTNPNFVDQIIESRGLLGYFDSAEINNINTLIEIEMRRLLELAFKFMDKDRRDVIQLQDVSQAVKQNGHGQLIIDINANQGCRNKQREQLYTPQQIFDEEMSSLKQFTIEQPKIQARWIYIKGKIPLINENINLKSMTQMISSKQHQKQQRRKFINVIKDDPFALLTKEQLDYFQKICEAVKDNINPQGNFTVEGDLNNLLPFFLKFLGQAQLNQTAICFLLKLIDNKYVWLGIQYYLKKILSILLAYKGEYSFEVGTKIAQLVDRFSDKYPILRDIFVNYKDDSYSTILKKISFQLQLGIPLEVDKNILEKCKEDSERNNKIAIKCMNALLAHSGELKMLKQYLLKDKNTYVYWHPCSELIEDPYLRMF